LKNAVFWVVEPCGSKRADVSEERIAFIFKVTTIGELGTTLTVTSNIFPLTEATRSPETSDRKTTLRHIPGDSILHSYRRKILKAYNAKLVSII
jgi:hypothetical protein